MKKLNIPKMRDAISRYDMPPYKQSKHVIATIIPSRSFDGENHMIWSNCDKMSSVGEMGAGGGS